MATSTLEKTRPSASTSPVLTRLAEPLHPREWVSLQTGLTNAQRVALWVLVSAYTGFQLRNGEFYIVESLVARYLSITFATFRNYVTLLHKLGLLTLKERSLNQYCERSIWAMNLDLVLHTGQLPLIGLETLESADDVPADTPDAAVNAEEAAESVSPEPSAPVDDELRDDEAAETEKSDEFLSDSERAVLDKHLDDPEFARLLTLPKEAIMSYIRKLNVSVERLQMVLKVLGQEGDKPPEASEGNRGKETRKATVALRSELLVSVERVLKEVGARPLREAEVARVAAMEADWRKRHPGEIPDEFVSYAAEEAARSSERDWVSYMLRVLEDSLQRGFTSRKFPKQAAECLNAWGVKKTRY